MKMSPRELSIDMVIDEISSKINDKDGILQMCSSITELSRAGRFKAIYDNWAHNL